MRVVSSKKWIVLLNKSPRGPFTEDEIKELMSQGLLRHNDLGFLLPEAGGPQESSWKFLWQFSEFDSRLKEKENPPPPAVLEKRNPRTEAQIQKDIQDQVPLDLKSIRVEDLVLKTQSAPKREFPSAKPREDRESASSRNSERNFSPSRTRPLFALLGIGAVAACVFLVLQEFRGDTSKKVERSVSSSEGPKEPGPISVKRGSLPTARRGEDEARGLKNSPRTRPPSSQPAERDRGEVREEEILRIREEERKRELDEQIRQKRLEEERSRAELEEAEAEADEEERKAARSKRKSKRGVDSQEENEEEIEESSAKETSAEDEGPPANWVE